MEKRKNTTGYWSLGSSYDPILPRAHHAGAHAARRNKHPHPCGTHRGVPRCGTPPRNPSRRTFPVRARHGIVFGARVLRPRRCPAPAAGRLAAGAPRAVVMALPLATVKVAMAVYALLMGGGGLGAYAKTKSSASAISGVGAAAALAAAYTTESVPAALAVAVALTAVFAVRYVKTKKVMPAAVLGAVSAAAALFFGVTL